MTEHLVLAAVDGSQNALVAAGVAARFAKLLSGRLGLVTVLQVPRGPLGFGSGLFSGGLRERLMEEARAEAEGTLQGVAERIHAACGLQMPEYFIATGVPEVEIPKIVASDPQIIMVVVGRQGFGTESKPRGLPHALGDLGAKLSMSLRVPVLTVPADALEGQICAGIAQIAPITDDKEG
ncbi:universal stress protein [Candidatus Igneacidithiobacillus taiwanensis]|uniref:universal stress protein n=1 Tax=Candidatus Igneacidithiobacillus taiwanensis TaxID=1945924 RepID=UPI00289CAB22|nr:universal stress protein [Candidatus Igneacidithiobacillus taiwanensis]MCE5360659.1 universal stress protein [Acidithiobacillus sp.]